MTVVSAFVLTGTIMFVAALVCLLAYDFSKDQKVYAHVGWSLFGVACVLWICALWTKVIS